MILSRYRLSFRRVAAALICLGSIAHALAQDVPSTYFNGLSWRLIGPFRGGRAVAVSGVPGSSTDFYFGSVDGGVWKTTDAGTVWKPVFDSMPTASIGALAVSPSSPSIIYAGSGESDIRSDLASGDGVYKSMDAGMTWKSVGLHDTRQISRIIVDSKDPNLVYVGALGHAYKPNDERGVYKSIDGGGTWKRVLDKGPDVGISDLAIATSNNKELFAGTWNAHRPPWSTYAPLEGSGNGLYRSLDAGETWQAVTGSGLPGGAWGRVGVAVSADGRRVYALIADKKMSGLYRSNDGGDHWTLANADPRLTSRAWYFNCITIDPENADVLYIPNVALYRTEDGGKTIQVVRGAPGGDDYHQVWVDPTNSARLLLGVDQGTSISLDYGKTWSTWYNQPTAQLYHVTTDHAFPYAVYGSQQDSGAIAVLSSTDHGQITPRDWFEPGGSESGYIAIDPKDENNIYITGTYGDVERFDRKTSFSQNVTPWPLGAFDLEISKRKYRDPWTPVLVFSPADHTSLYLGTQYVMKTTDGGLVWKEISPDLTGAIKAAPDSGPTTVDNARERGYGVVYTIAPSPLDAAQIWAGSDTGLIHLTRDSGKTWQNVTPQGLTAWSKIAVIEASRFDAATAYAAVDRHRLDDRKPYLYITHDYGKTWKLSASGIASDSFVNVVREDTQQKDLLYAGTELGIYASFNAGASWQPLQMNLPVTSVRDIEVHGDDLVVATHGRSFWILDDITPLRETAEADRSPRALLYTPSPAVRVDNDQFVGTPLPPEEPTAENPPQGAIFDYLLKQSAEKITLEVVDSSGAVVRHFSSEESHPAKHPPMPIAERWFPVPQTLATSPGQHRFLWDLASGDSGISLDADADDDAGAPHGPRVPPGMYRVCLTVDGTRYERPLKVLVDPRLEVTVGVMQQQYALGRRIYEDLLRSRKALAESQSVQQRLDSLATAAATHSELSGNLQSLTSDLTQMLGAEPGNETGLLPANAALTTALRVVESGHRETPASALVIYEQARKTAAEREKDWSRLKSIDVPRLNRQLEDLKLEPIQITEIEQQVEYLMTR
ncbi:MAG TPA: hypothetical protein VGD59_12945 [Acidisarcina sp.]